MKGFLPQFISDRLRHFIALLTADICLVRIQDTQIATHSTDSGSFISQSGMREAEERGEERKRNTPATPQPALTVTQPLSLLCNSALRSQKRQRDESQPRHIKNRSEEKNV